MEWCTSTSFAACVRYRRSCKTESPRPCTTGWDLRAGTEAGHYKHFGRVWKLGLNGSATEAPWAMPPEKARISGNK